MSSNGNNEYIKFFASKRDNNAQSYPWLLIFVVFIIVMGLVLYMIYGTEDKKPAPPSIIPLLNDPLLSIRPR